MENGIKIDINSTTISFYKEGWKMVASADNEPGLLDLIENYYWNDNNGYLYSQKLKKYLHRIILEKTIGERNLQELTKKGFVVDHINNSEPYNCCKDNLHIILSDINKAKGYTVDKDIEKVRRIVGIGLYCLKNKNYQIAIGFNVPVRLFLELNQPKDVITTHINFDNFNKCYNAIQIILSWAKGVGEFNINHLQASDFSYEESTKIQLTNEEIEEGAFRIERNGKQYMLIRNDGSNKMTIIHKPAKKE